MTPPDWPALLARLHARKVDVRRVLQVSRVTLWYWRTGTKRPNGVHALSLEALDRGAEISRGVNHG
jgi:DNA-binding transcriptional regulator YiaG